MGQTTIANRYTHRELAPYFFDADCLELPVELPPSVSYNRGQILTRVTASANGVQTLAISGSPTGGTFTLSGVNPLTGEAFTTAAIAYNAATSAVQSALNTALGYSAVTVTGSGALPGNTHTITFGSPMDAMPIQTMTSTSALTGGSSPAITITRTVVGQTAGTFQAVSATGLVPTTAPTVAGNGSGSSFAAGTYLVSYTFVTALGESTPSPATAVTATAAQNLRVSAITSLNAAITSVNYYVNGVYAATTAVSSGSAAQTDITGATITVGRSAPEVARSYQAHCILRHDCATDAQGNITHGSVAGTGFMGETRRTTPAYFSGVFDAALLTGLSADTIQQLNGRLLYGSTSDGVFKF